jgi:protein-tyrosine phosphatase
MTQESRVIELEGVHNFRDYGGYPVSGGGRLRRGVLWRSGQHHGASDRDLARIAELDLAVIIDLRFDLERTSHPCRRSEGFTGKVIFVDEPPRGSETEGSGAGRLAPHVAAARASRGRDAAATRAMMLQSYTSFPFQSSLVATMRLYLAELAQDGGPRIGASLIHCMAGKDRTGIAVAVLQRAVGVHHDDVMADFLLTNTAGNVEARIAAGGQVVQGRSGAMDPEALRVLMSVEPEYLDTAFATIAARYGSEDAYLSGVLGADAVLREKLRDRLVEG